MRRRFLSILSFAVAAAFTGSAALAAKPISADRGTVVPGHISSIAGAGGAPTIETVHNFAPFSVTVNNPADANGDLDPVNVALGNVPAGSYNHWTATVNWHSPTGPFSAWTNEAFIALSPTTANNALNGVWYGSGFASNGAGNNNPATLTWNSMMNFPYAGGGPMNFWGIQTFDDSGAQWDSVTITFDEVAAPPAPASVQTAVGGSTSAPLAASQVHWYRFTWDGAAPLTIDTFGSTLSDGGFGVNDTELGLYSELGALILLNDDINPPARESSITLDPAFMPAGTYWLAAGAFNTTYNADFNVTSTSTVTGTLVVNGISIPEPASLGLVALVGAGALARRRRA